MVFKSGQRWTSFPKSYQMYPNFQPAKYTDSLFNYKTRYLSHTKKICLWQPSLENFSKFTKLLSQITPKFHLPPTWRPVKTSEDRTLDTEHSPTSVTLVWCPALWRLSDQHGECGHGAGRTQTERETSHLPAWRGHDLMSWQWARRLYPNKAPNTLTRAASKLISSVLLALIKVKQQTGAFGGGEGGGSP